MLQQQQQPAFNMRPYAPNMQSSITDESVSQRYEGSLGSNNSSGEFKAYEDQLLESDEFKMYFYKVIACSQRVCHDWTTCQYAHPGEKAARRDPRLFNYVAQVCAEIKKSGHCDRGNLCMYAHNVFEYWLHPTKYRTQLCNDGADCRRKVCFFAHSLDELRVPAAYPSALDACQSGIPMPATVKLKDALAQEKAKTKTFTGNISPVSPANFSGVVPTPPLLLPKKSQSFDLYQSQPSSLQSNSTEATMAKTQDLLQQLQLMQAFQGMNVSDDVALGGKQSEDWVTAGLTERGLGYCKNVTSSALSTPNNFQLTSTVLPQATASMPSAYKYPVIKPGSAGFDTFSI